MLRASDLKGGHVKVVLMDEFHLTVYAPRSLQQLEFDAIQRTLNDVLLHTRMRRVIRRVFRLYPALQKVKIRMSR